MVGRKSLAEELKELATTAPTRGSLNDVALQAQINFLMLVLMSKVPPGVLPCTL